jgi:hypothetical protein
MWRAAEKFTFPDINMMEEGGGLSRAKTNISTNIVLSRAFFPPFGIYTSLTPLF